MIFSKVLQNKIRVSQVPPKRRGQVVPQKRGRHRFPLFILITMAHFVYIIYSKSVDKFYVGETLNVAKRFEQHNSGFYKAAFSKQTTDWKLFWAVECNSRRQALKLEKFIKNMKSRKFYFKLKENPTIVDDILKSFTE